jgi:flagellar basal-body rod protein FlgC
MQAFEISRTGMDVEWRRLEVIAQNIANANTVRTGSGQAYQPLQLLSGPQISGRASFSDHLQAGAGAPAAGVEVYGVVPQSVTPRRVYDPTHPQADPDGYVTYPGIDQAGEMTTMIKAARVYEANVVAANTARQMYAKALDLGRK